jgi:hypothetical protein
MDSVLDSFDVPQDATVQIATHWREARNGSRSKVHLNFYVPKDSLRQLVTEYSDQFAESVQRCLDLLARSLFGRKDGERLELTTYLDGMIPLRYWLVRENDLPPKEAIDGLGQKFEQFTRSLAAGPILPIEQRQGQYLSSVNIEYRRRSKKDDGQLDLYLDVPATATSKRFKTFRSKAQRSITLGDDSGKRYFECNEKPSSIGYEHGLFELHGEIHGKVTTAEIFEEIRRLFDDTKTDLQFPD